MAEKKQIATTTTGNHQGAEQLCIAYRKDRSVPSRDPGIGKSDALKQLAKELGIGFMDVRLANKLPEDISGIPVADLEKKMAIWLEAEFWPHVERDGEHGILVFDEMSDAHKGLQSCANQIILDRQINSFKLIKGWWPVAAGNNRADRAAAQTLSTALANRFAHIEVVVDVDCFVEWCNKNNVDPLMIGFIRFRPNLLHDMAGSDLRAFPTPRTWVMASKFFKYDASLRFRLIRGFVGDGAASVKVSSYVHWSCPRLRRS